MQPSMFNVRVPSTDRGSERVPDEHLHRRAAHRFAGRADAARPRRPASDARFAPEERDAIETLAENGFIVESREAERQALEQFFHNVREDSGQLRITVLTTLQCNFACDYCIQGDHGDYNKHAAKMSLETAARTAEWAEAAAGRGRP